MKKIIKNLYEIIPFKNRLFHLVRKFYKPSDNLLKHFHFKGTIVIPVSNEKSFKIMHRGLKIENEIFWKGITRWQEGVSMNYWLKACEFSNCIFDVGAYNGIYALASKAMNPNASVYAFEPVEHSYIEMRKNIEMNDFEVHSFKLALSNQDGHAKFYNVKDVESKIGSLTPDLFVEETVFTEIETKSIATFIHENKLKKIDLIKIDVEGHEFEVLEGMKDYLKEMMPVILVEVLTDKSAQKIQHLIDGTGYLIFDVDEINPPKKIDEVRKSGYFNLIVCSADAAKKMNLL
ncbi:MAG: FkbM family methyltransferase [Bacteroidia bacterium]